MLDTILVTFGIAFEPPLGTLLDHSGANVGQRGAKGLSKEGSKEGAKKDPKKASFLKLLEAWF